MILDVYEAVTSRRAVRGFTDRPVPRQVLERVLSAAAWAPSGSVVQEQVGLERGVVRLGRGEGAGGGSPGWGRAPAQWPRRPASEVGGDRGEGGRAEGDLAALGEQAHRSGVVAVVLGVEKPLAVDLHRHLGSVDRHFEVVGLSGLRARKWSGGECVAAGQVVEPYAGAAGVEGDRVSGRAVGGGPGTNAPTAEEDWGVTQAAYVPLAASCFSDRARAGPRRPAVAVWPPSEVRVQVTGIGSGIGVAAGALRWCSGRRPVLRGGCLREAAGWRRFLRRAGGYGGTCSWQLLMRTGRGPRPGGRPSRARHWWAHLLRCRVFLGEVGLGVTERGRRGRIGFRFRLLR